MMRMKSEKGMMTVEVVLGLTVYIAFFVLLLNFINILYIRQKFQAALRPVAIQISREYEANKTLRALEQQNGAEKFTDLQRRNGEYYRTFDYAPNEDFLADAVHSFHLSIYEVEDCYLKDYYLQTMGIVGGFDGIDFSGSTIDDNGNGEVDLAIKYEIRIINLPFFDNVGINISIEQHACTKLWY